MLARRLCMARDDFAWLKFRHNYVWLRNLWRLGMAQISATTMHGSKRRLWRAQMPNQIAATMHGSKYYVRGTRRLRLNEKQRKPVMLKRDDHARRNKQFVYLYHYIFVINRFKTCGVIYPLWVQIVAPNDDVGYPFGGGWLPTRRAER